MNDSSEPKRPSFLVRYMRTFVFDFAVAMAMLGLFYLVAYFVRGY